MENTAQVTSGTDATDRRRNNQRRMPVSSQFPIRYIKDSAHNHIGQYRWNPENPEVQRILQYYASNGTVKDLSTTDHEAVLATLEEALKRITILNEVAWHDRDGTELLNRNAFIEKMKLLINDRIKNSHQIEKGGKTVYKETGRNEDVTVALIDLNYLKSYNNISYIYSGDRVLNYLANYIQEKLRHENGGTDKIFRYGGDEFAVIMRGCNVDNAKKRLQKILKDLAVESIHGKEDGKEPCLIGYAPDNTVPTQVSACFGCTQLNIDGFESTGSDKEIFSRIIKTTMDNADEAAKANKEPSKTFAATIMGGFPACSTRTDADSVITGILEQRLKDGGKNDGWIYYLTNKNYPPSTTMGR